MERYPAPYLEEHRQGPRCRRRRRSDVLFDTGAVSGNRRARCALWPLRRSRGHHVSPRQHRWRRSGRGYRGDARSDHACRLARKNDARRHFHCQSADVLVERQCWNQIALRCAQSGLVVVALALAVIYRYGPSREKPRWRWISWGSALAAVCWIGVSILFSWYAENFGSYNKTYGSLGAIIAFMFWIWLSIIVVLIGGEINAETEHQTVRDTTTGRPKPMGARGATMADTVGAKQG